MSTHFTCFNKKMTDDLQIHNLLIFSFLMLGKELYLKTFGHSQVFCLNLIEPNSTIKCMKESGNLHMSRLTCIVRAKCDLGKCLKFTPFPKVLFLS